MPKLTRTPAAAIWAALVAALSACGGGGAVDPANQITLDSIAVTPNVVNVQTGAQQPLTVTAFANGQALSGVSIAFETQDGAIAIVDGSGVVRGVAAGAAVIVVSASISGTTRTVNVAVNVTTGSSPGGPVNPPGGGGGNTTATVSTSGSDFTPTAVTIVPGGSVTWQISGATHNVTFGANQPTGGNVPNTPSGGSATRVFPNAGNYPYQCTLHSNMNGTVLVQAGGTGGGGGGGGPVQNPDAVVSAEADAFNPERVDIAPGGTVLWVFSGGTNNVTFEEDAPAGGNIPDTGPGNSVARTFPVEGDYDYESTRTPGMKGRIRVRAP